MTKSNAIVRYLGRKYHLYGDTLADGALIDEVLDGCEALRLKHFDLIYNLKMEKEATQAFKALHLDPAAQDQKPRGAHWFYLDAILARNSKEVKHTNTNANTHTSLANPNPSATNPNPTASNTNPLTLLHLTLTH